MITLDTIEQEVKNLPPLKQTIVDVMIELNHNEVDFGILEKKISRDPALAVRILAVSNSPFYGFAGQIDSIKEACLVLGIHTTRNIVITAGVLNNFKPSSNNNLDIAGLWHHSLATGAIAKVIAMKVGRDAEQAFLAGLLHDIGKMVLDVHYHDEYEKVVQYKVEHDCLLNEAEQSVLGFNHFDIGGRIIRHWKLPEDIAQAIEQNSTINSKDNSRLAELVHVANIVARGLEIGDSGDDLIPMLNEYALKNIGLDIPLLASSFEDCELASKAAGVYLTA